MTHHVYDFTVSMPCPHLDLVNIYQPAKGNGKFIIGMPRELIATKDLDGVYVKTPDENPGQMVLAKSQFAPEVGVQDGDIDLLVDELWRLQARNLRRDNVFLKRELTVLVQRNRFKPYNEELLQTYADRDLLDSEDHAVHLILKKVTVQF